MYVTLTFDVLTSVIACRCPSIEYMSTSLVLTVLAVFLLERKHTERDTYTQTQSHRSHWSITLRMNRLLLVSFKSCGTFEKSWKAYLHFEVNCTEMFYSCKEIIFGYFVSFTAAWRVFSSGLNGKPICVANYWALSHSRRDKQQSVVDDIIDLN